jgi:hypothetical protein
VATDPNPTLGSPSRLRTVSGSKHHPRPSTLQVKTAIVTMQPDALAGDLLHAKAMQVRITTHESPVAPVVRPKPRSRLTKRRLQQRSSLQRRCDKPHWRSRPGRNGELRRLRPYTGWSGLAKRGASGLLQSSLSHAVEEFRHRAGIRPRARSGYIPRDTQRIAYGRQQRLREERGATLDATPPARNQGSSTTEPSLKIADLLGTLSNVFDLAGDHCFPALVRAISKLLPLEFSFGIDPPVSR